MKPGESPYDDTLRQERRAKALALRKAGKSYREIAAELKVDPMTAHADLQACFLELKGGRENIEELRDLELARLDSYLVKLEQSITGEPPCAECGRSDVRPIDTAVKIGKRRSELKGLDAPTKVEKSEPDEVAKMTPEEKLAAHEKAAAELRQQLGEVRH